RLEEQRVWLHLMPLQACFATIDANAESIFFASSNLGTGQEAFATIFEMEQHVGIVIKGSAFNEGCQVSAQRCDFQAANEFEQVFSMSANIADTTSDARSGGIGAPCC